MRQGDSKGEERMRVMEAKIDRIDANVSGLSDKLTALINAITLSRTAREASLERSPANNHGHQVRAVGEMCGPRL